MEQHPVPQNVTTFQFRLIGDMTIRQFGYLAGGAILGYICYKLPLPFFFTYPLAFISILGGIGFAFVPVEDRPMDVWVLSFIKSVYSPTQYIWQKTKPSRESPVEATQAQQRTFPLETGIAAVAPTAVHREPAKPRHTLPETLARIFGAPHAKSPTSPAPVQKPQAPGRPLVLTQHVVSPLGWLKGMFAIGRKKPSPTQAPHAYPDIFAGTQPSGPVTGKRLDLTEPLPQQAQTIAPAISQAEAQESKFKSDALKAQIDVLQKELQTKSLSDVRILELQKQLTEALNQRNTLEQELAALRLTLKHQPVLRPMAVATPQVPTRETVKVISPDSAVKAGLPRLTTFPNVVTGIVKDYYGDLLPGVLVTVRDKDDIPVRALKTNKLGQFAASTPLSNGVYVVEVEDPRDRFGFDRAQITVMGTVMPPLEIIAKSKKEIARDKLAREIFGTPQI